ncbi:MAG: AMP-binding protein, partial [Betaproteobacteria bacterium]
MPLYLTQCLHRTVQSHPERLATVFGHRRHNYRLYADRVARFAGALQKLGMARGDRVGMLALNSDRYLEFYYGTWWAGGAVNPVNFRWSAAEIAYSLDDCDTRILLVDDQFKSVAAELRGKSKALTTLIYTGDGETPEGMFNYEQLLADAVPSVDVAASGNDLAAVMYTGGTTGFPKGVMLSHENLASNALALVAQGSAASDGRTLLIAPMFHIAAGFVMNGNAVVGGTFIIAPAFNPLATLQAVQEHRVTHMVLVPTMVQLTVDHPDAGNYDLSSLRLLLYGGSVISVAVLQRAMARFINAGFMQAYGMTEMAPVITGLTPEDHLRGADQPELLGSAGRASLITEIRIVDVHGSEVP